jgi:aerobic carbon-monoxide dehydrogenase medium subunit
MKAAAFNYVRAASLSEACELLAQHGEEARLIAGGQSLVPALNLRLLSPTILIDIGRVHELRHIELHDDILRIGAMTRHADLHHSPVIAREAPLLARAITHVAHAAIRTRGTIGGNLANADPASELPACMLALDATLVATGPTGSRRIAAADFFLGMFETALAADEILSAVEIPRARQDERFAFLELARRHGDYAIVGVACRAMIADGRFGELHVAYFAVGDRPVLAKAAAGALVGRPLSPEAVAAAKELLDEALSPHDDLQASSTTRLELARVLFGRAVDELTHQTESASAP